MSVFHTINKTVFDAAKECFLNIKLMCRSIEQIRGNWGSGWGCLFVCLFVNRFLDGLEI